MGFFSKKDGPPLAGKREGEAVKPKPEQSTPAAKPVAPKPVSPGKSAAQSGEDSLDFSAYVPPVKSEPPRVAEPAAPRSKPAPGPSAPVKPAAPAAVAKTTTQPAAAAPPAVRSNRPPDSIMSIEVSASSGNVAPVIEEVAILFANGQVRESLAALTRALKEDKLGACALQAWLMLFDLYQHLGMKAEYEALALEFAVKFERSPPVWGETEARADASLPVAGGTGHCSLAGTLTAASAVEFAKLRSAAARLHSVRIDCSRLQGLDGAGAACLRETLLSLRDAGKEVHVAGEAQLLRLLEQACQPGKTETNGAVWSLLFDVCRLLGRKEAFEDAAVNYAVTFEVSPPSWETGLEGGTKRAGGAGAAEPAEQALVLAGEITGPQLWRELKLVNRLGVTRGSQERAEARLPKWGEIEW